MTILVLMSVFDLNIRTVETGMDKLGILLAVIAVAAFCFAVGWSLWRTFKIEDTLNGVMVESAKTTSMVFIILLGAAMLTAAFRGFGGENRQTLPDRPARRVLGPVHRCHAGDLPARLLP